MRRLLIGLGVLSVLLLIWSVILGVVVMRGGGPPSDFLYVCLGAAACSILTHVLATLRTWGHR